MWPIKHFKVPNSKTTFVTVNRREQFYRKEKVHNSKTTFVTVNLIHRQE